MEPIGILLLKPDSDEPSPVDQSLGARLAAAHAGDVAGIVIEEASFRHGDLDDLKSVFDQRHGNIAAVVGQRLQVFQAMWLREMQRAVNNAHA